MNKSFKDRLMNLDFKINESNLRVSQDATKTFKVLKFLTAIVILFGIGGYVQFLEFLFSFVIGVMWCLFLPVHYIGELFGFNNGNPHMPLSDMLFLTQIENNFIAYLWLMFAIAMCIQVLTVLFNLFGFDVDEEGLVENKKDIQMKLKNYFCKFEDNLAMSSADVVEDNTETNNKLYVFHKEVIVIENKTEFRDLKRKKLI